MGGRSSKCWKKTYFLKLWFFVNPLTPGKLRKNGTFKQQMAFFGPV